MTPTRNLPNMTIEAARALRARLRGETSWAHFATAGWCIDTNDGGGDQQILSWVRIMLDESASSGSAPRDPHIMRELRAWLDSRGLSLDRTSALEVVFRIVPKTDSGNRRHHFGVATRGGEQS